MTAIAREVGFSRVELTLPAISLTDDDYTISLANINPSEGATIRQRITFDGSSKLLFDGPKFIFIKDVSSKLETRQDMTAGVYELEMECIANDQIEVSLTLFVSNASVAPTFGSLGLNAANTVFTVPFSEEVYGSINKADALVAADFTATLTGGTATTPVISVPVHSAGDSTISFTLAYTGTADGDEVLKIVPADGASVYNRGSVPMAATESAEINLNVV
jgi:ribosomal protein L30/L7E